MVCHIGKAGIRLACFVDEWETFKGENIKNSIVSEYFLSVRNESDVCQEI